MEGGRRKGGIVERVALVPGLSRFDLPFAFTIVHRIIRSVKIKMGKEIHHVNDVRWTRGGCRGGGAQLPKQRTQPSVRVLYCILGS